MHETINNLNLWLKALHIIFVVMWFAGLFYLPRLFVYHADTVDEIGNQRFKVMERKLFIIMTVGAVGAVIFGLWLLAKNPHLMSYGVWLQVKLAIVLALIVYHFLCLRWVRQFSRDANTRSHKYYRWWNEVPALVLFSVVILVVVKPF